MPDPITNNSSTSLEALDNVSLENVHNPIPNADNTTDPSNTGNAPANASTDTVKPVIPLIKDNVVNTTNTDDDVDKGNDTADNNPDLVIKSFDDLLTVLTTKNSEQLTDEESNELSDIVGVFGGEAFNKNGDIVDSTGKVVYTAEQVKFYLTNNILPVDDEGDFVNALGEVVKSKIELFRANTTVGTVMNALANNFDVTFSDTFLPDDTEDSIIDVVSKVVEVVNTTAVSKYFQSNPELEAFRKHLVLHGSAKGYTATTVDYSKVDVKELSKEAKDIYIAEAYKATGRTISPAFAKYLDSLPEEDYNNEVADNLKVLATQQVEKQKNIDAQLKQKQEQEVREAEQYWGAVTNTIKNGKLSNITVPLSEREGFLNYVTKPVQNGKSQDILDAEKDDITADLLMSYLRYKGNDISALAKNIAQTQQVSGLRERMAKNINRNINSGKGHKPRTQDNYIPNLGEVIV